MGTKINTSFDIPCSLSVAIQMMSSAQSLDRLMEASYAQNPQHLVSQNQHGELEIRIYREFEGEWPGFLQSIIGNTLKIDEKRVWQPATDTQRKGWTEITAPGLPVEVKADMKIVEVENQCTVSIVGEVKVNLPFVAGKVEQMVLQEILDAIKVEENFYKDELKRLH